MPSTTVPTLRNVGVGDDGYARVEEWAETKTNALKHGETLPDWSIEDLGRLTRLAADVRSDIDILRGLAADVDLLIRDAIDQSRERGE